ncbi:MAG: hypothetical protein QXP81_10370 [Nitrososphaerota archaeon]
MASWSAFGEYAYPRLRTARVLVDNSGGASPITEPLFTAKTRSLRATIRFPRTVLLEDGALIDQSSSPPILIGNVQERFYTLSPGDSLQTGISDLSMVYVTVPAGAKVYLEVAWEEVPL